MSRSGETQRASSLREVSDSHTVEAVLTAYEREGARLVATARALALVAAALRGRRFVARL